MKILITGAPGSGKTSVSKALKQRGYVVYDADDDFGQWIHKESGETYYTRPTANRKDYYWEWRVDKIERLLKKTKSNSVIFTGTASNQTELYKDFDKVVMLKCDFETIKHRLRNRTDNPFGKRIAELDWVRKNFDSLQSQLQNTGVIKIDADQPLTKVVDEVIRIANED